MALVIPDLTAFGLRVLVTLGTPTINQIVNVIKETKIDKLSISLNGLRISHLQVFCSIVKVFCTIVNSHHT